MPDGGDDRKIGGINGTRHALIVEGPEVLDRAAAAPCDDEVGDLPFVCIAQRARDLRRCLRSLHAHGQEHDLAHRPARFQDAQHIMHRRARGRGDDGDAARVFRQRLFVRRVEKALFAKRFFELLEGDVQIAHALHAQVRAVELVSAVARKNADAPEGHDLHAVFRSEAELCRHAAEHHAAKRAPLILERKVMVPRGVAFVVRYLAAHEDRLKLRHGVKQRLDEMIGLGYAEDHLLALHVPHLFFLQMEEKQSAV